MMQTPVTVPVSADSEAPMGAALIAGIVGMWCLIMAEGPFS